MAAGVKPDTGEPRLPLCTLERSCVRRERERERKNNSTVTNCNAATIVSLCQSILTCRSPAMHQYTLNSC